MRTKIQINVAISERSKLLLDKIARDKKITKSALIEQLIIDYFDEKKDKLALERIENLEKMAIENDNVINSKIDAILEKVSDFDVEKVLRKFIEAARAF